jgi:hypothetical protein
VAVDLSEVGPMPCCAELVMFVNLLDLGLG